jgi:hypothetical protein
LWLGEALSMGRLSDYYTENLTVDHNGSPGTYYWGFPMRILTQHEITKITLVSV